MSRSLRDRLLRYRPDLDHARDRAPARRRRAALGRLAGISATIAVVASYVSPWSAAAAEHDIRGAIDIGGGRQMYVECRGSGSPTVVLIAGKGNGADDWSQVLEPSDPAHDAAGDDLPFGLGKLEHSDQAVMPSVARFTRVCAYDRSDIRVDGDDLTTPRPQPHTVDLDVSDLGALLTALGEPGPYVLVAHSYGGLIATLYARTTPATVGGLVMVDSVTPLMEDVVSPARLANWDAANSATSPEVREGVELIDAFQQIKAAPPMPTVPAIVLSADKPWRVDLLPADIAKGDMVSFADWLRSLDLLAAALGAEHVTRTNSGHDIYLYTPAVVVDAIRQVVDQVRLEQAAGVHQIDPPVQLPARR
jgi:pimeloyl-ACP methyl ester carboxylesterase